MKRQTMIAFLTFAVALPLFPGCKSIPRSQARPTERDVISLASKWNFRLDPNNVGIEKQWHSERLTDKIKLPGSTAENGFGYEPSTQTRWTGSIIDRSWFTDPAFEQYRKPGSAKVPFWLTPAKHYVGPAWYQKQIEIPNTFADKRIALFLERCHWETRVWIDGEPAGTRDSLCTPHRYDLTDLLTPGPHLLTIRVDNSMKYDVGPNAHSVSDHTQSNWNGIAGKIELRATDRIYIEDIQVFPDIETKTAKAHITIANTAGKPMDGLLYASVKGRSPTRAIDRGLKMIEFSAEEEQTVIDLDCPLPDEDLFWDEFSPATYVLNILIRDKGPAAQFLNSKKTRFGMRKFAAVGSRFTINDRPTFLRGTLECSIFPRTGYPPTDSAEWTRILRAARAHGLNHIRFHSWCPPEAAFEAADKVGIMLHVECPAWATIGNGEPIDKFIYDEGDRILKEYGNHPSFCMMAYGNEPGGKNQKRWLGDLVKYWKQKDTRRLYTSAAGWPIIPESDFHSTPKPRGHQWGAGLTSRFNANPPETATDYSALIKDYNVPVVSHEIGQWCVYPNFDEIKKYTGVLKARNFEIFRDSLAANHMLDQARDFLMASGKLQALLYKEEIESSLRTPGFAGFQLLDLHDFPGQGTALVGILDPFWESKGYITAEQHRRYCAETVPLLRMRKRIWTTDETFAADAEIAHFGPAPIENATVEWSLRKSDGSLITRADLPSRTIPMGNATKLAKILYPLANVDAPARLSVTLSVKGTEYSNNWQIWVYPKKLDTAAPSDIIIARRLDEKTMAALDAGKSVLLMPSPYEINSDIPAGFTTIFWNTAWTRRQPPHTLGLLCDPDHAALANFPTEFHSDWQWWDLVTKSKFMILDNLPPKLRPIVRVIDDWTTNRRLALIFEAKVSEGRLLVCSIDLATDLENRPVARQMLRSLLDYIQSPEFEPAHELTPEQLDPLFRKPPPISRLKSVSADSHHPSHPSQFAVDGNPDTIWHTHWENNPPNYPHEIRLEFQEPIQIAGLKYLPRQDMENGWISQYQIYATNDLSDWGQPIANGTFKTDKTEKTIIFDTPQTVRHIRFTAKKGIQNQIYAAIAELDIVRSDLDKPTP